MDIAQQTQPVEPAAPELPQGKETFHYMWGIMTTDNLNGMTAVREIVARYCKGIDVNSKVDLVPYWIPVITQFDHELSPQELEEVGGVLEKNLADRHIEVLEVNIMHAERQFHGGANGSEEGQQEGGEGTAAGPAQTEPMAAA